MREHHHINRIARGLVACALMTAAACSDTTTPERTPALLNVTQGNAQFVAAGSQPTSPLQVRVTTSDNIPVAGVMVTFTVTSGDGSIAPSSAPTDGNGYAATQLTLGGTGGTVTVQAAVQGSTLVATFTITAAISLADCSTSSVPSIGTVVALSGSALCARAGSSAVEYALIPFYGTSVGSATTSFQVTAAGTSSPSASPDVIATTLALAGGSSFSRGASRDVLSAAPVGLTANHSFERALRSRERRLMAPLVAGARSWQRSASTASGGALRNAIPASVSVGQYLTINANADSDCSAPLNRAGRVVAITAKAIVVADTLNPSGGYSDAEYASLGVAFDTLIDPLDTRNFGQPSDIDHNGKILMFFTKAVNDLTPATSQSYIGGFFYARDLFPTQSTPTLQACASSNVGELFYLMVPDPARGGPFSKGNVTREVLATVAHEYQHLINASRRLYVNTSASDFEEVWLNEGLSHIAEELLFYQVAGIAPRLNLGATEVRQSTARIDAFNAYAGANFSRYAEYLGAPSKFAPYADNDSLATRGATWAFLRYAADRRGTTDSDTWNQLVNSTTTGIANLRNVFGSDVLNQVRDWQTSVLTDDVTGFGAPYQQGSWNFRSIFAATSGSFPLAAVSLTPGTRSVTLVGGGSAYLRFVVPANSAAPISWTTVPSAVQMTLVRTK